MNKKSLIALSAVAVAMAGTASAEETGISGGVDFVSSYIFRGFQLADEAIQPYVEFSKGDFYGGAWFSTPIDSREFYENEVNLYGGFGFDISESLWGDVGFTRYIYTDSDGESDTTELYFGVTAEAPVAPALYETETGAVGTSSSWPAGL